MEPEIGQLYESNKKQFERVAKWWTWRYAMHDALIPEPTALVSRPLSGCGPSSQVCIGWEQDEVEVDLFLCQEYASQGKTGKKVSVVCCLFVMS